MDRETSCRRAGDAGHSRDLIWYAAGGLEPGASRSLEAHLRDCAPCRDEVDELRSFCRTFRRQAAESAEHPAIEALLGLEAGELAPPAETRSIRVHLETCPSCREELEGLEGARSRFRALLTAPDRSEPDRVPPAVAAGGRRRAPRILRRSLVVWAGAGVVASVALVAALLPLSRGAREAAPVAGADGTFLPDQRSARAEPVLQGRGPWSIVVELPFGAAEGSYRVRIETPAAPESRTGPALELQDEAGGPRSWTPIVGASRAGRLVCPLPALPRGRYLLLLEPPAGGESGPYTYSFRVGRESAIEDSPDASKAPE